jgi:hypothetical protein
MPHPVVDEIVQRQRNPSGTENVLRPTLPSDLLTAIMGKAKKNLKKIPEKDPEEKLETAGTGNPILETMKMTCEMIKPRAQMNSDSSLDQSWTDSDASDEENQNKVVIDNVGN